MNTIKVETAVIIILLSFLSFVVDMPVLALILAVMAFLVAITG